MPRDEVFPLKKVPVAIEMEMQGKWSAKGTIGFRAG